MCVYTKWKSTKRWRVLIHRIITKQQVKRRQTCSLCFVSMFKFQENKFKIVQKNFWEIKIILIKKRFIGKATSRNGHYIMNMGGQRPKIGSN